MMPGPDDRFCGRETGCSRAGRGAQGLSCRTMAPVPGAAARPLPVLRTVPPAVIAALLAKLVRRPRLWPVAARQFRGLAAAGWWRRRPFLPLPPADYARFRFQTMYGGPGAVPADDPVAAADDVLRWLEWAGRERRAVRTR